MKNRKLLAKAGFELQVTRLDEHIFSSKFSYQVIMRHMDNWEIPTTLKEIEFSKHDLMTSSHPEEMIDEIVFKPFFVEAFEKYPYLFKGEKLGVK